MKCKIILGIHEFYCNIEDLSGRQAVADQAMY